MTEITFAPVSRKAYAPAGWEAASGSWATTTWQNQAGSSADQDLADALVPDNSGYDATFIRSDGLQLASQHLFVALKPAVQISGPVTGSAITLPSATLTINPANSAGTTGFPTAGTLRINGQNVTYTGKTAHSFTGCAGGTGTFPPGMYAVLTVGEFTMPARAKVVRAQLGTRASQPSGDQHFAMFGTYKPRSNPYEQALTPVRYHVSPTATARAYNSQSVYTGNAGDPLEQWTDLELRSLGLVIQPVYLDGRDLPGDWRIAAAWMWVEIDQPPTVAAVSVQGATLTTAPTVTWSAADPEGKPQERFRVRIFTAAQYGAAGFDPETAATAIDSGSTASSAVTWNVAQSTGAQKALAPGTTYRAYVQVSEAGSGGRYGAPSYVQFTLAIDTPVTPTVTAVADAAANRVLVTVTATDNQLTRNQSSVETDTTGWFQGGNTTISRQTAQALNGSASMRLRSAAAGNMIADSSPIIVDVTAGQQYTAMAYFRAATVARACRVSIDWFTAAGAYISTTVGTSANNTTSGWTQRLVTGTAPATAASAAMSVDVLAAGAANEDHYVDQMSVARGTSTIWSAGAGGRTVRVERSDDAGVTWADVVGAGALQYTADTATFYDYTAPPNTPVRYRATTSATADIYTVSSAASAASAPVTVAVTRIWLKDPADPARNMTISVLNSLVTASEERQGVFQALGRRNPIVLSDVIGGERIPATLQFKTDADYRAFEVLRSSMRTLLLQTDLTAQWWVHLGGSRTAELHRTPGRRTGNGYRTVPVEFIEVDPPAGL